VKRIAIFAGGPLAIAIVILVMYLSAGRYISTENAYVRSGIAMVSAQTSGRVDRVFVHENQTVGTGDILFVLDMEPFDLAVDLAQARLDDARVEVALLKSLYEHQKVRLAAADEDRTYTLRELERVNRLTNSNAVSRERVSERQHAFNAAVNDVAAAQAEIADALVRLGGDPDLPVEENPKVRLAQSALSQAELDRSHATVKAGMASIIAKLDMHPGEYIQEGQPIFSLVRADDIWIEANLKETQLTNLQIGQSATFEFDTFPGSEFTGRIASISPASGAEFAILPPQNATGNWVKITQRIPVRLELDDGQDLPELRAGMSVTVTIDAGADRNIWSLF